MLEPLRTCWELAKLSYTGLKNERKDLSAFWMHAMNTSRRLQVFSFPGFLIWLLYFFFLTPTVFYDLVNQFSFFFSYLPSILLDLTPQGLTSQCSGSDTCRGTCRSTDKSIMVDLLQSVVDRMSGPPPLNNTGHYTQAKWHL
mgnify:CR=1 FL=1